MMKLMISMAALTVALAAGGALAVGAGLVCCAAAKSKNTKPKELPEKKSLLNIEKQYLKSKSRIMNFLRVRGL